MSQIPDVLMLSLATALRNFHDQGIAVEYEITQPRSNKFKLLDDHFVVRVNRINEENFKLLVAAKMGKEVR